MTTLAGRVLPAAELKRFLGYGGKAFTVAELQSVFDHIYALTAVVDSEVAAAEAWEALALINVTKRATELTEREETSLAELQDAARELVVSTSAAHRKALAAYRSALP